MLVAFEGISASGKGTQIRLLGAHLEALGREVVVSEWNSDPIVSEGIRALKREGRISHWGGSFAHALDLRARWDSVVAPALARGAVVVLDRYLATPYARDSYRGVSSRMTELAYAGFPDPDIYLQMTLSPADALVRRLSRHPHLYRYSSGGDVRPDLELPEAFVEYAEHMQRRYTEYAARVRARGQRWVEVESRGTPETVFGNVLAGLNAAIEGRVTP